MSEYKIEDEAYDAAEALIQQLMDAGKDPIQATVKAVAKEKLYEIGVQLSLTNTPAELQMLEREAYFWNNATALFTRCAEYVRVSTPKKENEFSAYKTRKQQELAERQRALSSL